MRNLQTVRGIVTQFQPKWVHIYPDVNTVKVIEKMGDFSLMVKPEDGLGVNLNIPENEAIALAKSLSENHLNIALGSEIVAEFTQSNGYIFHKLTKLNGLPFKYVTADAPKSASVSSDATTASAKASTSSSNSGIEDGLKSFKALFESTASSSTPSSASEAQSSSVSASSIKTNTASSVSSSINSSVSSEPDYAMSASSSSSMNSNEQHSIAKRPDTDGSDSLINKKLSKMSKYHSILENDDNYQKTSAMYESLANTPNTELNPALHKVYNQEGWSGFTQALWSHANVDFNETLNQRVTDARMNYALQCNMLPGGIETRKKRKPKPKPEHLTDKNVF